MRNINDRPSNKVVTETIEVGLGETNVFNGIKESRDPNVNLDKEDSNEQAMVKYRRQRGMGGLGSPCNMTPRRTP